MSRRTAYLLAQWEYFFQMEKRKKLHMMVMQLEGLARAPPLLLWMEPG
jgi:hypothetical protein